MTSPEPQDRSTGVAVIGCGLIGTSIAMAAVRAGDRVRLFDADAEVLRKAVALSGGEAAGGVADAAEGAMLVFVCTPIEAIPAIVAEALAGNPGAVVTDAGSVKAQVVGEVELSVPRDDLPRFVGGHPMGGSERSGPDGASASLLDGAVWPVTPTEATAGDAVERLEAWIRRVGADPVRMDPKHHDWVVAVVSHLPQVASTALMSLAVREESGEEEVLLLAAGGFRDLTRLAASNPELWAGILRSNREELAHAIDLYVGDLIGLRDLLQTGPENALEEVLRGATVARRELTAKPKVRAGMAILQIPVPDRPGVLADLTAAMGERGVNIEDLQIIHSPEGGKGTVHLMVAAGDAEAAGEALATHEFDSVRLA